MRLSKFLVVISFVTCFSLLYVYQQTEIFRLAYLGQKNTVLQDLLAKNSSLKYNIEKNASLTQIGNRLAQELEFQMPDSYRLMHLVGTKQSLSKQAVNKETLLSRIFSVKRQAQAYTFNP